MTGPGRTEVPNTVIVSVCMNDEAVLPQFVENIGTWDTRQFYQLFIDNGSRDNTLNMLRSCFPSAGVVESSENTGTTGAYNMGIRLAQARQAKYLLFLALDTLFAPDCLTTLIEEMERHPDIGAIGPVLYKSHDKSLIECMGFSIQKDWTFHPYYGGRRQPLQLPNVLDVDYIDGGSTLFRISALEMTGLLDERLFMYGEDVDICLRLKQKGYRVATMGKSRAWHRHTEIRMADRRPRPYQVFYQYRNLIYLANKYEGRINRMALYLALVKTLPRTLAYFIVREHSPKLAWIYVESLWSGLNRKMGKTKYVQ